MRIPTLLDKDFKLLFKDPRSLILVFLTPVVIIAILCLAFSTSGKTTDVRLAICGDDQLNLGGDLITPIVVQDCEAAKAKVRRGELAALLVIPEDFSDRIKAGYASTIDLYYDNAQSAIADLIIAGVRSQIQSTSDKLGSDFIFVAWSNLGQLNARLKEASAQLSQIQDDIEITRAALMDAEVELSTLSALDVQSQIENNLQSVRTDAASMNRSIQSAKSQLDYLQFTLENASFSLDHEQAALQSLYDEHCTSENNSIELNANDPLNESLALCSSLNDSLVMLQTRAALNDELRTRLVNQILLANDALDNASVSLDALGQLDIEDFRPALQSYEDVRLTALQNISSVRRRLDTTLSMVTDFQKDLDATTKVLDAYVAIDPQNIVRPIALNELPVFPRADNLAIMAPALILIVLLFTVLLISSTHIVQEKNAGTMVRILLAPLPLTLFLFEKFLFMLILSFIGVAGMLIVLLVFGIAFTQGLLVILIIGVAAMLFISIGFLLGAAAKDETTAVLSSLVLGLPLFFLSGAFIPLAFMGHAVQIISAKLPLTQLVIQLQKVTIYNQSPQWSTLAYLLAASLVLFIISILIVRRQLRR